MATTFWPRINTLLLLLLILMAGAIIAMLATRAVGGPLDPPGAPASTAGGIDGRIPISSVPFTISESGSYIVTKNLTLAGAVGITVNADNVTIDLNGFTFDGVDKTNDGIAAGGRTNLSVVNGVIRRWNTAIDNAPSGGGSGGLFHGLQIDNNNYGVSLAAGASFDANNVRSNGYIGIASYYGLATITNSMFIGNGTAIYASAQDLIESNHIEIPEGGTGIRAGHFSTIRRNYFGHPDVTGYVTIDLGSFNYVFVVENRITSGLTTGGSGAGNYIPYDTNNALTNMSQ